MRTAYETDFYAWTQDMAQALQERRFTDLDIENLTEEIEALGRSERREIGSRLAIILIHMLKSDFQPEKHTTSWDNSLEVQRGDLKAVLQENPSLAAQLSDFFPRAYRKAVIFASEETKLPRSTFPQTCPYTEAQILGDLQD